VKRVIAASGVPFTLHDLRRTFTTTAERLDISPYTIKRLINHRLPSDVTAGYIVIHLDRLRKPLQAINDFLLIAAQQRTQQKFRNSAAKALLPETAS
jgi:integrase